MYPYTYGPAVWSGVVHAVGNSPWERSARYGRCGDRIGADVRYDVQQPVTCPTCIKGLERDRTVADEVGLKSYCDPSKTPLLHR